ncbi:MAG TPA: hypothetical protein VHM90_12250 [Phycisphaerae bacterium]|jgi:hypothetical protein|nr:hypothetical protein [Phycisphaerae bacterium]
MKMHLMVLLGAGLLAGCAYDGHSFLEFGTTPERATYGAEAINVPPAPARPTPGNPPPENRNPIVENRVTGTWTFTTPRTVTRVERRTGSYDQFSLYNGQPQPTDRPFAIVTVTKDRSSIAEQDPATYKIANKREYVLNGGIAQEWTGTTDAGAGFCELIVRRPGGEGQSSDVCHAMALARNEEEQKLALGILGSIVWTAGR